MYKCVNVRHGQRGDAVLCATMSKDELVQYQIRLHTGPHQHPCTPWEDGSRPSAGNGQTRQPPAVNHMLTCFSHYRHLVSHVQQVMSRLCWHWAIRDSYKRQFSFAEQQHMVEAELCPAQP
jgi:hypothetical protein